MHDCEASHAPSLFMTMTSRNWKMSLPLRPSSVGSRWPSGRAKRWNSNGLEAAKVRIERSVEFKAKKVELQIQFEVQQGIHKPHQSLHAKGGGLVDLGNKLKATEEIAIWGAENKQRAVKKLRQSGFESMLNTSS